MENGLLRRVGLGLFCLTLLLAPLVGGYPSGSAYGADLILNGFRFFVLGAALLLTLLPAPADPKPAASRLSRGAIGFMLATLALTVMSLLVKSKFLTSPVLLFALVPGALDWILYGTVFLLALRLAREELPRSGILAAVLAGAVLSAGKSVFDTANASDAAYRAQAFFVSANFAAGLFALCLPVTVAYCLAAKNKWVILASGFAATLMGAALVASGSRAGIALAVVGLLVALVLSGVSGELRRLPWGRIGFLVAALFLAGFLARGAITARAAAGAQEQSGDFRKMTWRGTVNMAKANPLLGTGPGTYPYTYPPYAVVEKTDLAHSSYLQVAAEQGFPALLTVLATIAAVLLSALAALWQQRKVSHTTTGNVSLSPLLLCGLVGGVLASLGRSVFDSEWSLLGDGIPFWTLAGLLAGIAEVTHQGQPSTTSPPSRLPLSHILAGTGLAVAAGLAFACLRTTQERDAIRLALQQNPATPRPTSFGWPPDPELAALGGRFDLAAQWEPSGRRLYQLGRLLERQGELPGAVDYLRRAVEADPNNLQSWFRLASTLQSARRLDEALKAYQELVTRHEGPAGQVRALPEVTEIYPAFGYTAVGQAAAAEGNTAAARDDFAKAVALLRRYAETSPTYQQVEIALSAQGNINLTQRRQELIDLHRTITEAQVALEPERRADFVKQRDTTIALIEKMPTTFSSQSNTTSGSAGP